ncbi:MAG: hypothetical protein JNJ99_13030, partial [Crocinitomicaceae bacterium]|nr:hypothetical protein [Crocinitomicaceae bacterium]
MKSIIKSVLLVILLCTQNLVNSQAPEFKASRFYSNTETGTTFNQYLGSYESVHYFLKSSVSGTETNYYLHSIYSDLLNGKTIPFKMPESLSTNKWDTDRNAIHNNSLRVFGTYRLKKEELTYYTSFELNTSGELVNEKKLVSMTMDGLMNSGEFFSALSSDKSKYIVLFFHPEVKDQQTQKVT